MMPRFQGQLHWISRGPHGAGAVWTHSNLDARLVALLVEHWFEMSLPLTGDTCEFDLELSIDTISLSFAPAQ